MKTPVERFTEEKKQLEAQVPSARKSLGEYKPIMTFIIQGKSRTEVLGMADQYNVDGNKTYARGTTFKTREEAIEYATEIKKFRIAECIARAKKYGIDI